MGALSWLGVGTKAPVDRSPGAYVRGMVLCVGLARRASL